MSFTKLKITRENGLKFDQILKLTFEKYSNLSNININFYLKLHFPIMHRHFFRKLSQNSEHVQIRCNILNNPFHFACRKWYLYKNPQR